MYIPTNGDIGEDAGHGPSHGKQKFHCLSCNKRLSALQAVVCLSKGHKVTNRNGVFQQLDVKETK